MNFKCPACSIDHMNPTNLNKHLNECTAYPDWIKSYSTPIYIKCDKCSSVFSNKKTLSEHKINCDKL